MNRISLTAIRLTAFVLIIACGGGQTPSRDSASCSLGEPVEIGGQRRLALIVGVGDYLADDIPDLIGAAGYALRFQQLLTAKDGYGFPKENVCVLLDQDATLQAFKQRFEQILVQRTRSQDVAVLYFAGHGSQAPDGNGDEPDEMDETFVFHDSRTGGTEDLVDDELNRMLAKLHAKTPHFSVIVDSCNSATSSRAVGGVTATRFVPPRTDLEDKTRASDPSVVRGDQGGGWAPDSFPGAVFFSAAGDGTPALESGGRGIFTDALIQVLSSVDDAPLTYSQAARRIPGLVKAQSYQIPYFQGDLDTVVFGGARRVRPLAWEIKTLGDPLTLAGPPLPGMGRGAELRIFDGAARGGETSDPAKAKATVVVEENTELEATVRLVSTSADKGPLIEGDLAVLVRPADRYRRIRLHLRDPERPGGIPQPRLNLLRDAIEKDPDARLLVKVVDEASDFELSSGGEGTLKLKGPEGRIRNVYGQAADASGIVRSLWQHARQRAFLQLRGEGGSDFTDQETLKVRLVEAPRQTVCAKGDWVQAPPNAEQVVPLCHRWQVQVELSNDAPLPLLIGGLVLSSDGGTFGFPKAGRRVRLEPGKTYTFSGWQGQGTPPLDVQDHVLVFGTQETNPVRWDLLTQTAAARSLGGKTGLQRALDSYLQPGSRGTQVSDQVDEATWTMSRVAIRVEANARFLQKDRMTGASDRPQKREYTIASFDIRPYLPDDPEASLYKVLAEADRLARYHQADGIPYKQHSWSKERDEDNLAIGIDCSRSIWFAFTRADLTYNRSNRYLPTALMVGSGSWMADRFESCSGRPLQLGDVLVYRDPTRGDGHTIMVVDPQKRVGWGSHGWDGNVREGEVKDTGVEYQLIKYKKDWERWDRKTMELKACWRFRDFVKERQQGRGESGTKALERACSRNVCR